jgi:hypothetical protein
LTDWVPPFGCRVYMVPSLPVTVTCVAFAAVTVKVDALPMVIEVGLATIVTEGTDGVLLVLLKLPPHPLKSRGSKRPGVNQEGIR